MEQTTYSTVSSNNIEIERKFLLKEDIPELKHGKRIIQAYIFISDQKELRVRISENNCLLSIKIDKDGIEREEFEYIIPIEDGQRLIDIAASHPPIVKNRYFVIHDQMKWEIDVFERDNEGLILAEIELESPDQPFMKPGWVGKEVTHDRKYYNANIYLNPYKYWKDSIG